MIWYKFHIDKEMVDKRSSNKNIDSTSRKEKKKGEFFVNYLQKLLFLNYM